ncbi:hypothetical protein Q0Z83_025720 [Actinoplanes sichuanensis]|nr:hypothetical protein Q0Z83_025720 [Actinoplanes sichuanensis]
MGRAVSAGAERGRIQREGSESYRGDECAVSDHDLTGAVYRKSRRSGSNGGDCVEVADNLPDVVAVRDSKDRDGGDADVRS